MSELLDVRPKSLLAFGAVVASIATVGSLYFSLGMGLIPCLLCWYQRILMYPLVVVLGVAAVDGRPDAYRTVLPLSVLGAAIATYHSYLQIAGGSGSECKVGSCGSVQFQVLGLSIPNLSLLAFLLVSGAVIVAARRATAGP